MQVISFRVVGAVAFFVSSIAWAGGPVTPLNDPSQAAGTTAFDWQREWGTIHMNSFADGLNDPGAPVTGTGSVPCDTGTICKVIAPPKAGSTKMGNGIKFDIKNSLLNCMSKPMPNWAFNNPWNSDTTVCIETYGLYPLTAPKTHDPHTLIYQPLYDPRSNDARTWQSENIVGCQQAISNNCAGDDKGNIIRDVHACQNSPEWGPIHDDPGYQHPVTHVFSPQEVADLGGPNKAIPLVYFTYVKKEGATERIALADRDPKDFADRVPDSKITVINNGTDPYLARLKSYRFRNDSSEDNSSFIVMDPSDFFDLRLYTSGGKYASGYSQFDKNGLVQTYDSCPVLGLKSGYSGICDPTGKAGCNTPIYGVGAETTFTDAAGNTYTYNDYPLRWSGYAKKWAVISPREYKQNIKGREDYYFTDNDLNANPILMITRSDDYCEVPEMVSDPQRYTKQGLELMEKHVDMPCIQYLQYQAVTEDKSEYEFVDLYNPMEPELKNNPGEINALQLFDIDENGKPDFKKPVKGSGDNKYIGSYGQPNKNIYVSYLDANNPVSVYENRQTGQKGLKAVYKAPNYVNSDPTDETPRFNASGTRISGPVRNTDGEATAGEYLGDIDPKTMKPDLTKGAGLNTSVGESAVIRLPNSLTKNKPITINGEETSCAQLTYTPDSSLGEQKKIFVPTNSAEEFQAFATALSDTSGASPVPGAKLRDCNKDFQPAADTGKQQGCDPNNPDPTKCPQTGVSTWIGMLSCDQLGTKRPACNQTKLISAKRYCRLENGSLDECGRCGKLEEPDKAVYVNGKLTTGVDFSDEKVGGDVLINPFWSSKKEDTSRCFFLAACYQNQSDGCPVVGTSGGHVFCLSGDTKIAMADGTEKEIKKIKAGEEVVSFNAKRLRTATLAKAKVKLTAITKKQKIVKINNLRITLKHKIVLASGRSIPANDVKVGDNILRGDGSIEEVTKVDRKQAPITVYNLVLENESDGYIAGGMRVMSYPIMKGMENVDEKQLSEQDKRLLRRVSSIKKARH